VGGDDACLCKALNIASFDELATCDRTSPQHKLTLVLAQRQFVNLKLTASQISEDDRVRLISCSGAGSGAWLSALPVGPAQSFTNTQWRLAALFRLGLPMPCLVDCAHMQCSPSCVHTPDNYGHHEHACHMSSKWFRHERFLDVLKQACVAAGLDAHKWESGREGMNPLLIELLGNKMADLFMPDFRGAGMAAHLDVTIIHPLLRTYATTEYSTPGDAVEFVRALCKYGLYSEFDHTRQDLFIVFGAESYGALSADTIDFLNGFIVRAYVERRGVDPDTRRGQQIASVFRGRALANMAVAIQKANADLIVRAVRRRQDTPQALKAAALLRRVAPPPGPRPNLKQRRTKKQRERERKKRKKANAARPPPWQRNSQGPPPATQE
jgi:hypothetical protein